MDYAQGQIEKTKEFMEAARKKGLENERKHGMHSGSGLTQEQRASIMASVKEAENSLHLDESIKTSLLERFVMWSEHHGTKVQNEQHPYILRQLVDEFMQNDGWARSGYDGKIGATIRGAIIERADRINPALPVKRHYRADAAAAKAAVEKIAPLAVVPEQEADQYMRDVRAAFKTCGHTLRGAATSASAQITKVVYQFASEGNFNKFTLRHLLATFNKMAHHAEMEMNDSMAAAVLPKLAAELSANKAFLKATDNTGLIPLTVKEGDVSKDIQKEFPLLCEKAPDIVRRTVLTYQPHMAHLQKVMEYFGQITTAMPEDTRLYNANARAVAEYRHQGKKAPKAGTQVDSTPATGPAAESAADPMLPAWLSPLAPAQDPMSHLTRVIQGDWSKHDGRSGGRKK